MASYPNKSLSRIYHDLQENKKNPLVGVCLYIPDESNVCEIHSDIEILDGVYRGVKLHTIIKFPHNYPNEGPLMFFPKDFELPQNFHNHIHGPNKQICNDLLANFKEHFADIDKKEKSKQASGWVAGYDLNAILIQMQSFFSQPDFSDGKVKLKHEEIKSFYEYSINFKCYCMERYKMQFHQSQKEARLEKSKISDLQSLCICPITKKKLNYELDVLFGYPILRNMKNHKPELEIFFEIFSYEGYLFQKNERNQNENKSISPIFGKKYNYFLPIYINENHFKLELTLNCLQEIKFGENKSKEIKVKSNSILNHDTVIEVLNRLINRIIVSILKDDVNESDASIQAYCHLLRLFHRLCQEKSEIKKTIDERFTNFKYEINDRSKVKTVVPDLGEIFINLPFSSIKYDEIKLEFFKELLARQINRMKERLDLESFDMEVLEQFLDIKENVFKNSKVGLQLILFNLEATKCLITTENFREMDENYGFVGKSLMEEFKRAIQNIKTISNFSEFFEKADLNFEDDILQEIFNHLFFF